jgi:hypothetical protein
MADKVIETLLDALKQALTEPGEQRLFRSGKLDGLFPSRGGASGEAAAQAVRDGLLEVVRTDTKGKTSTEWVRATPRATEFLHRHESPVQALKDLHVVLQQTQKGVPLWLAEMQHDLQTLVGRLQDEAQRWTYRLDVLSRQVEEALRRLEDPGPVLSDGAQADAPWAQDALTYLEHRRASGARGECPLPELFAAVRENHPDLSVRAFHERLRRLHDRRALRLLPFPGPASEIPEPEYALPDGPTLLYFVAR